MARYRAIKPLFIERYIEAGEEFESDLVPGRNWEPIDEAAISATVKRRNERAAVWDKAAETDRQAPSMDAVEIPDDWADLPRQKRRGLAMKLGAPGTTKASDADSFITAELERRRQKAA